MEPCCRPRRRQLVQDYGWWKLEVPTCRVCADSIRQGYQLAHGIRARSCLFGDSRSVDARLAMPGNSTCLGFRACSCVKPDAPVQRCRRSCSFSRPA